MQGPDLMKDFMEGKVSSEPKIRDEILGDAAALGGKGFSAHLP
jgi:hypothetical protein